MRGIGLSLVCGPVPWEQFGDAVDVVVGDAGQDIAEPGFGIETVELGGFDQGVDGGGTFAAAVRSGEEIVLASQSYHPFILPR